MKQVLFLKRSATGIAFLAAGCLLFGYLLMRLGPARILELLARIGWGFLPICTIYPVFELVRSMAWSKCIAGNACSCWSLWRIRLAGDAVEYLTFTGPFLAEPAKALLLTARGLARESAFAAVISEYLAYTLTSAAMAVTGLCYLIHNAILSAPILLAARIVLTAAAAFLAVASVAISRRIYLIGAIVNHLAGWRAVGRRFHVNQAVLRAIEDGIFSILRARPGRLLSIFMLELLAQALLVLELFVLLWSIGQPFSPVDPFVVESATKFVNFGFFFIPGQVGAAEGVYAVIFSALGLPPTAGFSLALARRMRNLMVAGIGLAFWSALKRRADNPA